MLPLDDVKAWLGVTSNAENEVIDGIRVRAIADAERVLGVYLGTPVANTPVYLSGSGSRFLRIGEVPAGSPAPIIERETTAGVWEVVPVTDYQIIGKQLRHDSRWYEGVGNYRITYTRGYAEDSTDEFYLAAQQAILDLIALRYNGRGKAGFQSESIGGYSYTVSANHGTTQLPDSLIRLRGLVYS